MNNEEFLDRIREKISALTDTSINLSINPDNEWAMSVELGDALVDITIGTGAIGYPGFARMCIEFAVASIKEKREITPFEFQFLLQRN